jgi:gas vesicle structural protein
MTRRRGSRLRAPRFGAAGRTAARPRGATVAEQVLSDDSTTLLDLVDNALTKGVVLTGDVTIALAHVDLIYARLSLLLCAADRVLPGEAADPVRRLEQRHAARMDRAREPRKREVRRQTRGDRLG